MEEKHLKALFHGEVIFHEVAKLPPGCNKYTPENDELVGDKLIVGKSETTGNHHVVETTPSKIEFYEKNGQLFMVVKEDVVAGCVIKSRHDDMVIPPGVYKKKVAKQFDYFKMAKEAVKD